MLSHSHFLLAAFCLFALILVSHDARVHAQVVVTIENTDPRITWTPFVCNNATSSAPTPCSGGWAILPLAGASSGTVTSTLGPAGDTPLLPQLFLALRGTSLVLTTSSRSNATANVTLSAASGLSITTLVDSAAGHVSAVGLPPDEDVTLAVTYVPRADGGPARLDVDAVTVFAANSSGTVLSPAPTPTESALPSFVFPSQTGTPGPAHRALAQPVGTIVGEALAGFFGLVLIAAAVFAVFQWRKGRWKSMGDVFEMRGRERQAPDEGEQAPGRAESGNVTATVFPFGGLVER